VKWESRAHFFAATAQLMRRILIDHAKHHLRAKRGGAPQKISLDEVYVFSEDKSAHLVGWMSRWHGLPTLTRDRAASSSWAISVDSRLRKRRRSWTSPPRPSSVTGASPRRGSTET
jgi:hypothetical protein